MAMEVKLLQPVKVVCTDDLGETLVDIMQTAGYSRPLMVTDSFVGSMPLVVAARTKLEQVGVDVAVFDQVKPDPLCETVESGVEAFEAHKADSIIAIGGGSSMDVARGINIVRVNGGSIIEVRSRMPFAKKRCSCCTTICRVLWQTVRIVKPGNV